MADGMSANAKLKIDNAKWAFALCLLFSVNCSAEELPDPTRPPVSIAEPVAESGVAAVIPPAGLQSILIGKHRRAAIIDGQTVELGDRIGDARLVEVNTANVVLRTAHGKQVLTLFPEMKIFVKNAGTNASSTVKKVRTPKPVSPGEKK